MRKTTERVKSDQDLTQLLTIHTELWRCKLIKKLRALKRENWQDLITDSAWDRL